MTTKTIYQTLNSPCSTPALNVAALNAAAHKVWVNRKGEFKGGYVPLAKHRTIELEMANDSEKAHKFKHHVDCAVQELECIARLHIDGECSDISSLSHRVNTIFKKLPIIVGTRLRPIFSTEMLFEFPELKDCELRWREWCSKHEKKYASILSDTKNLSKYSRNKEIQKLFRLYFEHAHEELQILLGDLIALAEAH